MTFRTRFLLTGLLLIGLILLLGALALWAGATFHNQLLRTQMAHGVSVEYLRLSAHIYPLSRQLAEVSSNRDPQTGENAEVARLRGEMEKGLDRIRELIVGEMTHSRTMCCGSDYFPGMVSR